jgi:putative DNA primase/helicase
MRSAVTFLNSVFAPQESGIVVLFSKPAKVSYFMPLDREGWQHEAASTALRIRDEQNVYFAIGVQGARPDRGRGTEAGVVSVTGFWADIDILGPNHAAHTLPTTVEDAWRIIAAVPFKPTVVVYTGGGLQAYWLFREPWQFEDENDRRKVKKMSRAFQRCLQRVARNHGWTMDGTADLVRLLRLPGTYNNKQAEPVLVHYEVMEDGRRYNPSDFEEFVELEADRESKAQVQGLEPEADLSLILAGCPWMHHCKDDAASLSEPEWYRMLSIAGRCKGGLQIAHDLSRPFPKYTETETAEKLKQAIGASGPATCAFIGTDLGQAEYCGKCEHRGTIKSPIILGLHKRAGSAPRPLAQTSAIVNRHIDLLSSDFAVGDLGNAQRLIAVHGNDLRYNHDFAKWLVWDGRRWRIDAAEQARKLAQDTMLEFVRQAMGTGNKDKLSIATLSLKSPQIGYTLREAQPHIFVETAVLDRDPWLLNFHNGTLDLRTGALRQHRREDFLTKVVHYNYLPDAECPAFLRFLEHIMGGGPGASETMLDRAARLIGYLQKAFGYALTGTTSEKVVFIFLGAGNNGKSTLLSTFLKILEEYSVLLQIDTLMVRQENNNTQADLADLRGARFVMTSETEEGQRLAEGRLKRITQGMGKIKATRKYENPVEFPETHKLFMDANHKPVVRGTDNAIWNRLHPVPFSVTIPPGEIDPALPDKLLAEAEGILAWAVAGARRWYREGLGKPEDVESAGRQWRIDMDHLGRFIEERCITGDFARGKARVMYSAYCKWAEEAGERACAETDFSRSLGERGYSKKRTKTGKVYSGIGIAAK